MQKALYIFILLFFTILNVFAQTSRDTVYYLQFTLPDTIPTVILNRFISVDKIENGIVYAYANSTEVKDLDNLGILYEFISPSKSVKAVDMATSVGQMYGWDKYPTYDVYEEMMLLYAEQFPDICSLENIGTLPSGRKLLALRITSKANYNAKTELFFTSTMHGDETGGYVILLRFIDYLLTQYEKNSMVNNLIKNTVIWINPLANPDGTYNGGNATVSGAIRYNANNINLNRNFPDPENGEHPDGESYQPETELMMNFAKNHPLSLSVNIHSGAEVVNYPWDTWSKRPADDEWWKYVGGNYRDSAQKYGPSGYMNDVDNGLTNGYDWYSIAGGRQDYMNYFEHCREFTLEISTVKLYSSTDLPTLWESNKMALLGYACEALNGVHGLITDKYGNPLKAKIEIPGFDTDSSLVYSDTTGYFVRYLKSGVYNLFISAEGFAPEVKTITIKDGKPVNCNVILYDKYSQLCIDTSSKEINIAGAVNKEVLIPVSNCGLQADTMSISINKNGDWFNILEADLLVQAQRTAVFTIQINNTFAKDTTISFDITITSDSIYKKSITAHFFALSYIDIDKKNIFVNSINNQIIIDSLLIYNNGNSSALVKITNNSSWINITNSITVDTFSTQWIKYEIQTNSLNAGLHNTEITFHTDSQLLKIPVTLLIDTTQNISISGLKEHYRYIKGVVFSDSLNVINNGGDSVTYSLKTNSNSYTSILFSPYSGVVAPKQSITTYISIDKNAPYGNSEADFSLIYNDDTSVYYTNIFTDTLPELLVDKSTLTLTVTEGKKEYVLLNISNSGGQELEVSISENNNYLLLPATVQPLSASEKEEIRIAVCDTLKAGVYNTTLYINSIAIPVTIEVNKVTDIELSKYLVSQTLHPSSIITDSLTLYNSGDIAIDFKIRLNESSEWIFLQKTSGSILPDDKVTIYIVYDSSGLNAGTYSNKLLISTNEITKIIKAELNVLSK